MITFFAEGETNMIVKRLSDNKCFRIVGFYSQEEQEGVLVEENGVEVELVDGTYAILLPPPSAAKKTANRPIGPGLFLFKWK